MSKHLPITPVEILDRLKRSGRLSSVMGEIIQQQIIRDVAAAEGIEISDLELQQAADRFRCEHNLYNPDETWRWLKTNYLTGDDFEALIYESSLAAKLQEHLFGDRIEAYFYEHQLDYTQAVLYEIVLADFDTAIELFYAIEEGEINFIEVARQYIEAPDLRHRYGYRGILSRRELHSAISAAVFTATPPQLLKPIVVNKKAHLIWVEAIIEPQLDGFLRAQILSQLFSAWLAKQLQQYSLDFLP
jgi:parvulin-like peptidyl-prolyl isomerase